MNFTYSAIGSAAEFLAYKGLDHESEAVEELLSAYEKQDKEIDDLKQELSDAQEEIDILREQLQNSITDYENLLADCQSPGW